MNWKYEAIEKLRDYEAKKLALSTLPEEIRRLELDAQRIRSATGDGTPVKGGGSTREDILLSNIVHREELERSLEMARKWVALVDAGLEILSEEDRLVLLRFYMHPERGNVERLCGELGLEKSAVYDRREKALRRFTLALYGGSWIDGSDCLDPKGEEGFRGPMGMVFCRCRGVTLRGYTYRNAANWCHQLDSCIQVRMDHVTVLGGHDGINLHHCTQVWIDSCDFRTGDDCIAGYDAENVVVRNCSLNTSCNSFRFGGRNLLVEHCRFWGPGEYPHRSSGRHNTLFAFAYYAFHYDLCRWDSENWVVRNCTFEHLDNLIYYNYGGDWNHNARPLRDLTLEHITIRGLAGTSHITTLPESPITVTCKDLSLSWRNGLPQTGVLRTSPAVRLVLEDVRVEGVNQSPAQ